jgi:hypothetical protein
MLETRLRSRVTIRMWKHRSMASLHLELERQRPRRGDQALSILHHPSLKLGQELDLVTPYFDIAYVRPCRSMAHLLDIIPPEVCLHILEYLLCPALATLTVLSKEWQAFMDTHSETIYRTAAWQHRFIDNGVMSVGHVRLPSFSRIRGTTFTSWKHFCEYR